MIYFNLLHNRYESGKAGAIQVLFDSGIDVKPHDWKSLLKHSLPNINYVRRYLRTYTLCCSWDCVKFPEVGDVVFMVWKRGVSGSAAQPPQFHCEAFLALAGGLWSKADFGLKFCSETVFVGICEETKPLYPSDRIGQSKHIALQPHNDYLCHSE